MKPTISNSAEIDCVRWARRLRRSLNKVVGKWGELAERMTSGEQDRNSGFRFGNAP